MTTLYFALLFFVVLALYGLLSYINGHIEFVTAVEAGSTMKVSSEWVNSKSFKAARCRYLLNGVEVDSSNYMRLITQGNCMKPLNIVSGMQLLAEKVDEHQANEKLKQGCIVLIYLEDVSMYKIRIFDKLKENMMLTYYYNENGVRQDSSRPHSLSTLRGVVRYALP